MTERSCQSIDDELIACTTELSRAVSSLNWSREDLTIYNPLAYARLPHETYIRRYITSTKRVLFLGMNPGPWGMAQTGVLWGDRGSPGLAADRAAGGSTGSRTSQTTCHRVLDDQE